MLEEPKEIVNTGSTVVTTLNEIGEVVEIIASLYICCDFELEMIVLVDCTVERLKLEVVPDSDAAEVVLSGMVDFDVLENKLEIGIGVATDELAVG